ncbi:YfbU family protein [Amycolatopsis sp. lyj-108]|uniref:YfbU family protein n=1 Tax=Amycolatopsis sp. lyj-108 TaxID=2789286 RepID=UPI00397B01B4
MAELGDHASRWLSFAGFDHNHERERNLASFAECLIAAGRWEPLAYHFDDEHEGGNSHMPVLHHYEKMLGAYRAIIDARKADRGFTSHDTYHLDGDDLRTMLNPPPLRTSRDW